MLAVVLNLADNFIYYMHVFAVSSTLAGLLRVHYTYVIQCHILIFEHPR
jgi:hypothetical protein